MKQRISNVVDNSNRYMVTMKSETETILFSSDDLQECKDHIEKTTNEKGYFKVEIKDREKEI